MVFTLYFRSKTGKLKNGSYSIADTSLVLEVLILVLVVVLIVVVVVVLILVLYCRTDYIVGLLVILKH